MLYFTCKKYQYNSPYIHKQVSLVLCVNVKVYVCICVYVCVYSCVYGFVCNCLQIRYFSFCLYIYVYAIMRTWFVGFAKWVVETDHFCWGAWMFSRFEIKSPK